MPSTEGTSTCKKIEYDHFFSNDAKKRTNNYLRFVGTKCIDFPEAIKLSNGNPNVRSFPITEINVKMSDNRKFTVKGQELNCAFDYGKARGYPPLVALLKEFQDITHGRQDWIKRDITLTCGAQDAMYKVLDSVVDIGDPILIQSPVYTGMPNVLQPHSVEFLEIESDEFGLNPDHLQSILKKRRQEDKKMPKILYVNPTASNPTGTNIPTERKKIIYQIACDFNFLILEDDPYYHITFNKDEKVVSFLSLDYGGRVVRLDSMSKICGAGFRIGYITAAAEIINKIVAYINVTSTASPLSQIILYGTLSQMRYSGFLDHVSGIVDFYRSNRDCMLENLDKHMKDLAEWTIPAGGLFVWIKLKILNHVSHDLVLECIENMVLIAPGFAFYTSGKPAPFIRLSFSMVEKDEIQKGILFLAGFLRDYVSKHGTTVNCMSENYGYNA